MAHLGLVFLANFVLDRWLI